MMLTGLLLAAAVAAIAGALALRSGSARDPLERGHSGEPRASSDLRWYREIDPFVLAVLIILVGLSFTAIVIAARLI